MHLRFVRFAVASVALAAAHCSPPGLAQAAGPPQPMLDVDVVESAAGAPSHSARLSVPALENGQPSSLEVRDNLATYKLRARVEGTPQDKRVSVELDRVENSNRAEGNRHVQVQALLSMTQGGRYVVGKVKREDGRETEVFATLR